LIAAKFWSGSEKAEQLVSDFHIVIVVVVGGFFVVVIICILFVGVAISSRAASELLRTPQEHPFSHSLQLLVLRLGSVF
jgi:hypothetical protein